MFKKTVAFAKNNEQAIEEVEKMAELWGETFDQGKSASIKCFLGI